MNVFSICCGDRRRRFCPCCHRLALSCASLSCLAPVYRSYRCADDFFFFLDVHGPVCLSRRPARSWQRGVRTMIAVLRKDQPTAHKNAPKIARRTSGSKKSFIFLATGLSHHTTLSQRLEKVFWIFVLAGPVMPCNASLTFASERVELDRPAREKENTSRSLRAPSPPPSSGNACH